MSVNAVLVFVGISVRTQFADRRDLLLASGVPSEGEIAIPLFRGVLFACKKSKSFPLARPVPLVVAEEPLDVQGA